MEAGVRENAGEFVESRLAASFAVGQSYVGHDCRYHNSIAVCAKSVSSKNI